MANNRNRPLRRPSAVNWKLFQFIKTTVVLIIFFSGMAWLAGSLIEGFMSQILTIACAIIFLILLITYCAYNIYKNRKEENRYRNAIAVRKRKIAQIEADGFTTTFKSIGSSRHFAVDENRGEFYLIDYYNHPEKAKVHKLSSVIKVFKGSNAAYIPPDHTILLFNGKKLSEEDAYTYFSKMGVVIELDEPDCPYEFINCFKTENDGDIILNYFQNLLAKRENGRS